MLSLVLFAVSAHWPAEVLAKLENGVDGEVRPPWSNPRS